MWQVNNQSRFVPLESKNFEDPYYGIASSWIQCFALVSPVPFGDIKERKLLSICFYGLKLVLL